LFNIALQTSISLTLEASHWLLQVRFPYYFGDRFAQIKWVKGAEGRPEHGKYGYWSSRSEEFMLLNSVLAEIWGYSVQAKDMPGRTKKLSGLQLPMSSTAIESGMCREVTVETWWKGCGNNYSWWKTSGRRD
jgi:hypothetical protein